MQERSFADRVTRLREVARAVACDDDYDELWSIAGSRPCAPDVDDVLVGSLLDVLTANALSHLAMRRAVVAAARHARAASEPKAADGKRRLRLLRRPAT